MERFTSNAVLSNTTADGIRIQVDESTILSPASGKCLDLPGGDTTNGALLWMWDCYGGDTQKFSFRNDRLVYSPDPGKCVDLIGGDTTNGTQLGLWDCDSSENPIENQRWRFVGAIYPIRPGFIHSGVHEFSPVLNHKCMRASTDTGGPVHIWDCDAGDDMQTWQVGDATKIWRDAASDMLV